MGDEPPIATRLQMLIIGAATTVLTTGGTYISSHWGGVTAEQLGQAEGRLGAKIAGVEMKVAKSSDDLKEYVDDAISSAEERLAPRPKKRKERRAEP